MSTTQKTLTVKLYGNLGGDPELRSTREQVITRSVYDPTIDDAVERAFHKPGREFHTFSRRSAPRTPRVTPSRPAGAAASTGTA